MSVDASIRIPDVKRYILFARDMSLYADIGWDDTKFGLFVPDRPGGIFGTYFTGIFGDSKMDLCIEYAQTSEIQFNHFVYLSGYTLKGSVLSHSIGSKGKELFARLTRDFSPNLSFGFQLSSTSVGPTGSTLLGRPREKRNSLGMDLSYRVSDGSSVFMKYDFSRVSDRGFVGGRSSDDNAFRIEFTRSIGQ